MEFFRIVYLNNAAYFLELEPSTPYAANMASQKEHVSVARKGYQKTL